MSDADLTRTIHAAVLRLTERILDRFDTSPGKDFDTVRAVAQDGADWDLRRGFALGVIAGWISLSFLCLVAMFAFAVPLKELIGASAGDPVALACLGGAIFCVAGAFNVMWRMYWYVPQARRRARTDGVDSARFKQSMRRSLPRNTSLVFQSAAALLAIVLAI